MKLTELFIADIERERDKTRKAVEAVPEGKGVWKPHDKAMPFGRLAGLVAQMPSWIAMMIAMDEFDVAPATPSQFSQQPKTRAELTKAVEDGFAGARTALEGTTDDHLMKTWRLKARKSPIRYVEISPQNRTWNLYFFRGGARLSHSALSEQYKPAEGKHGVSGKAQASI